MLGLEYSRFYKKKIFLAVCSGAVLLFFKFPGHPRGKFAAAL